MFNDTHESAFSDIKEITGLRYILDKYEVFIIDLWGVIHDGIKILPGVLETLRELNLAQKSVYLTTNNPRTSQKNIETLTSMGLDRRLYKDIISAGEKALDLFKSNTIEPHLTRPVKTYVIDDTGLCDWINEAKLYPTDSIDDAELILAIHVEKYLQDVDSCSNLLSKSYANDILLVCPNPDLYVTRNNQKLARPGTLSLLYKKMGGRIIEIGKPNSYMYEKIFSEHDKNSILIIGDSLLTDIASAQSANIDSVLITYGCHKDEFHSKERVKKELLCNKYNIRPTFICNELVL